MTRSSTTRSSALRAFSNVRHRGRSAPLQALRDARALPITVLGPVDRSHGRHFLIAIAAPMRQAWINSLRDMLAELLGSVLHYYAAGYEDRSEKEYQRVTFLESRIQLMLNQGEEDHKNLEKLIREMVATLESADRHSFPGLYEQVRALSRQILKREWDRVKGPLAVVPLRDA